jgi:hypothetical protein
MIDIRPPYRVSVTVNVEVRHAEDIALLANMLERPDSTDWIAFMRLLNQWSTIIGFYCPEEILEQWRGIKKLSADEALKQWRVKERPS